MHGDLSGVAWRYYDAGQLAAMTAMRPSVAQALALVTALLLAGPAVTEQPIQLYPCSTLGRLGTMDENGVVTRPATPQQLAANMTRYCSYVVSRPLRERLRQPLRPAI